MDSSIVTNSNNEEKTEVPIQKDLDVKKGKRNTENWKLFSYRMISNYINSNLRFQKYMQSKSKYPIIIYVPFETKLCPVNIDSSS